MTKLVGVNMSKGADLQSQMAPSYASLQIRPSRQDHDQSVSRDFTLFPQFPPEIRAQIWQAAFSPRIIKWTRKDGENVFTVPSDSFPLFDVCQESRQVALLYGEYRNISTHGAPVYFSTLIDYLLFDAGWVPLVQNGPPTLGPPLSDPLDSILPAFKEMRKIIVHPNFTDERKRPTALFEKLPKLEQLLIGADEKSMGVQNKFILSTVYDTKMYYSVWAKKQDPEAKVPHIAVGCLGWRGTERRSLHHGDEDKRELVGIFEKHAEMALHLQDVRDEERRFLEEAFRRDRPKLTLNLRPVRTQDEQLLETESADLPSSSTEDGSNPPSYSRVAGYQISGETTAIGDTGAGPAKSDGTDYQGKTIRPNRWYDKILRGEILSLANSPSIVINFIKRGK